MIRRTVLVAALLLATAGCGATTSGVKRITPKTANVPTPTVRIISPTAGALLPSHGPLTVHLAVTNFTLVSATSGNKPGSGQIVLTFGADGVGFTSVTTSQLTVQINPPPGSNLLEASLVSNGKPVGNTQSVTVNGGSPTPAAAVTSLTPSCPAPPNTTPATSQEKVTLPVTVVTTQYPNPPEHTVFPKSVTVVVPRQWAGEIAAYGVAGCVLLAPTGWSGSGTLYEDGGGQAQLRATPTAAISGSMTYKFVSACGGCAMADASLYFPSVVEACQQAYGTGFGCGPPLAMKRDFLRPGLVAYSISPTVNGVAETDLPKGFPGGATFAMVQVSLPRADVPLETVLLNYFISVSGGGRYLYP